MGKNDFRVDTTSSEKKTFFKKKQTLLGLAFLLTVPQKLKESDGGYTEDCFSVLTNRLIKFPQDTLYVLKYDKLMNDKDFQQLVLSGIKTELPYRGSDEERNTLYQYLESITTDKEYGQIASAN